MNERIAASEEQVAAAIAYEELFVKGLFEEWTTSVLDAARINSSHRVLDVGCGTGVLARKAAIRIGPKGFAAGIDPNPGMLAVAEQLAPTVEWWQGTAESLPFQNQSFDAAVSQFSLMFFSDREKAISEMLRIIKPQGQIAVAVWDSIDRIPAYGAEVDLLERIAGKRSADALRAPFVLGNEQDLAALFRNAGATSVEIATQRGTARFPSIRMMVEADLRGWLPVMDVVLSEEKIQHILEEAQEALSPYLNSDGSVVFDSSAHIVSWTKT
jgi:SAM-dependent methyltransferase